MTNEIGIQIRETERSKTFIKMGEHVGIEAKYKTQRGIIAKKFMPLFEKFEDAEFAKHMKQISLPNRIIRINGMEGSSQIFI